MAGGDDERIRLRPDAAAWREVDGETILLDLRTSTYLGVNRTGTLLWPALVDGATRAELVGVLVDRYGIDAGQAQRDVDSFVETCRSRDLLEVG